MIGDDAHFLQDHHDYVKDEAEREPVSFRQVVELGCARIMEMTNGLNADQAAFQTQPGATTIIEIVQHVATVKRWTAKVCADLAAGRTPDGAPGESLAGDDATFTGARLELEGAHDRIMEFADSLWPMTDLDARWPFGEIPPLNCKEWAVWQHLHDSHHADEIEAIQADGGYPFSRQVPTGKFRKAA